MVPLRAAGRRLARDRRGVAAVEFALLAPVLLLLMAGLTDGSRLILASMQLKAAAQAGADFALRNGWDAAGVSQAVTSAGAEVKAPSLSLIQGCIEGGAIKTVANGASCSGGAPAGRYVTVEASSDFHPVMPWPAIVLPDSLTARAMVRIP